jgi:hypothetical protein
MGSVMTMRGPTAKLERFAAMLARAGQDIPARVSQAVEHEVMPLIQQGYNTRSDPYGKSWKPPLAGNPPMERKGAKLRKSYEVIRLISAGRWTIYAINKAQAKSGRAYYGAILQHGFVHRGGTYVEPRKQVPDKAQRARRWELRMRAAAQRAAISWAREVRS